jgi:cyclomaltodextrinase / maltogenic alpha-amylase / neopullulanase
MCPNEIDDDTFWSEFRHVVKSANPDAYLVGEIWTPDPRWVGETHFDGLMHYPVRDLLLEFLEGDLLTTSDFAGMLDRLQSIYPRSNVYAMYLPLGSHDTERVLTRLDNNLDKLKLAYLFLFAYPGAPAVYYGDEIGLTGGKDPECRGAFPWENETWNIELRGWVKTLISWRKNLSALRRGSYRAILADDRRSCFAFVRSLGDQKILVIMNASSTRRRLKIPVDSFGWREGYTPEDLLGASSVSVTGRDLVVELLPWKRNVAQVRIQGLCLVYLPV